MEENDFFYKMITLIGSIVGGVSLGVVLVAYFLYPKNDKYNNNDESCNSESNSENGEEDSEEEEEEYFNKYFDELTDLDERELTPIELENLRLNVLEEETPEGKVIMTYNSDIESFCYYADSKTIAYRTLDTAARLFTITYNCKNICVNYKEEFEKGKEQVVSQKEKDNITKAEEESEAENKTIQQPTEKPIFAKFKSYNTTTKPNNVSTNTQKNTKNNSNNSNNSNKKYYIMTEKANKFRYKGTLEDFLKSPSSSSHNTDMNNTETNITPKMDYATFKANYVNQIEKKNN